ncbi:unnamed protein product [Owenia fusiformis]|uniref:Uncharacterized protein n=1 Tax=Owenia fusiformis TaxID=6347 RepID=A0A8J1XU38_OWEFU|nr:unnamed protein product [Owenia fusiformis]
MVVAFPNRKRSRYEVSSKSSEEGAKYASTHHQELEEPEQKIKQISFFQLFRFADTRDTVMTIIGLIGALIHGFFYVAVNIVFGETTDVFVNYTKSIRLISRFNVSSYNLTNEDIIRNRSLLDPILIDNGVRDYNSSVLPVVAAEGIFTAMRGYAWWYVFMGVMVMLTAFVQISFFMIPAERQMRRIRTYFLKACLRQNVGWYDELGAGELNTRLSDDILKISDGISDKLGTFIQYVSTFVWGFVIGFVYGWKLSLVMLATVPGLTIAVFVMGYVNSVLTNVELKAYAQSGKIAEEVLGSMRTVAAFGGEKKECERYNNNLGFARQKGIQKGLVMGLGIGFAWFICYCAYSLGFWYGAKLIREEDYSAGILLIVFFSVVTGAVAIGQAAPNLQNIGTARGAAYTIYNIIDRIPPIDSSSEAGTKPSGIKGNIEIKNLHFCYPTRPDVKVLQGISLKVGVGESVALVGSSGCGKSTSVQLIQRFYDPLEGSIEIDGIDIREFNIKWWRNQIGIVSQEPILFGTTIAENIRYGRDDVTQQEIEQAAKESNAHNFIMEFPDRYETLVGERGGQMSGGQKQRIAIARALVRNPKILLLDEATSALDTESEATVQNALDKARQGRTTIVIAHRLSTIRYANLICGFEGGKIVEQGSHEELMDYGGIYYQLVTLQTREDVVKKDAEQVDDSLALLKGKLQQEMSPDDKLVSELKRGNSFRNSLKGSLRGLRHLGAGMSLHGKLTKPELRDEDLDLSPTPEDEALPPPQLKRLAGLNSPEWPYILGGCLAAIFNGAEMPIFAIIFSELLVIFTYWDMGQQERDASMFAIIFLILGAVVGLMQFLQTYLFSVSGEGLTMRLRQMAFKAMMRQDIGWFDNHKNSTGALCTRLATDASSVQGATGSRLGLILMNAANIGAGIIIAFVFGWRLALVMMGFVPVLAIAGVMEVRVLSGVAGGDKKALENAGKIALEALENIRTIAALTKEEKFYSMYYEKLKAPYKSSIKKAFVYGATYALSQATFYFAFAAGFTYGAYLIEIRLMQMSDLFKVFSVIILGAMGMGQAAAFAPDYAKAKVAAARLFKLFDRIPAIDTESPHGNEPPSYSGAVEFVEVKFRYPSRPEVPVLRGLNLSVTPGQTLALVGSSGCGKSTSVQLIERFYDALAGSIILDGSHEIHSVNVAWLRRQIGIVSQEPVLFDASIAENIMYGDNSRNVTMDEVIQAAKSSNIHNFISSLPDGYNTSVGDKGAQLSGGQKQRVAIARALVRNPKILLLDEATSALDTESEKIVQEALDRARQGRTCIVIAHRLSTIQDSDKIAVISNGRVAEIGNHEELLRLEGIYYNLQNTQRKKRT